MAFVGSYLLAHVFSALLPPVNPNDEEFYEILGLEKNATNEQIRKAYKVKSLKLHPDKVAQRGHMNQEEAAAQYEKVQEAYGVLVNDSKRQKYHAVKCSVTRYRFIEQSGMANPGAIYENLTSSSFSEKTRLVFLTFIILMLFLMQPILIAEKINQSLENENPLQDVQWSVILIPYWIFGAAGIILWCGILVMSPPETRTPIFFNILQQLAWYVAVIFLAEKWDGWSETYEKVLIPLYIAAALNWIQRILTVMRIRSDVAKMVTLEFLEKEVLKGKSLEDLTPEEQEKLREDYIVITVPPDFEPIVTEGVELDDKGLEEQKVESSPEYEMASEIYNSTLGSVYGSGIFGSIFLVLLTLKLNESISPNWWTVFTPIWIYIISRLLFSCFGVLCGTFSVDLSPDLEAEMQTADDEDHDDKNDNNKEKKDSGEENKKSSSEENSKPEVKSGEEKDAAASPPPKETTKESSSTSNETTDKESSTEKSETTKKVEETIKQLNDGINDTNSDDGSLNMDEETFRAWQNAYVEAEKGALEAQTKAAGDCCVGIFQLVMLCLIVSKIEVNYNDDPSDVGINVFWILSPLIIFFGLIWCCCACMIYGASRVDESDLYGGPSEDNGRDEDDGKEETNHVFVPGGDVENQKQSPTSPDTGANDDSNGAANTESSPQNEDNNEENPKTLDNNAESMEDLD